MARSVPILAPLCLLLALIGLCWPVEAQSKPENGMLIEQITSKGNGDVCKGVTAPASCPINCFRADPVCGVDGRTYWCGCDDALCSGTTVAKIGACDMGNGGSASLPRQALLLVHILWLILLGFSLLFGLF
ncbi:uncharacterized protein LOC8270797 [Ricinus communis]|uniref:Serine-type endopeptidase inhibitor, putative n=1 Tax=Ricinus communis TaxID=3988 RepID=B9RMY6_RICCO|nr:uncharacterized protein LOC8270797 [Ricinus communis]EEF47109.1 serine-type endopeptidase inhibitor, putative [Ricinus communis]|eukprot:XP_002515125.1 uncharacterized protein LOC8270797 [Ricinus communis]